MEAVQASKGCPPGARAVGHTQEGCCTQEACLRVFAFWNSSPAVLVLDHLAASENMIIAAAFSHAAPETLCLLLDALIYSGLTVAVSSCDAARATTLYLAACLLLNAPRHLVAARAACNQFPTAEGQLTRLPAAVTTEATAVAKGSVWQWLPAAVLVGLALIGWDPRFSVVAVLLAAEAHFIACRVHGDCRGGKPAPTLAVLMLHAAGAATGCPVEVTLSLHRLLVCWTYFLTGARKLYCVGLRWCDGKNLQLMCAIQGLYHDHEPEASLNFFLSRRRQLCAVASVGVVAAQLLLPLALALPQALPLALAFTLSFHAMNLVLWRINFYPAW